MAWRGLTAAAVATAVAATVALPAQARPATQPRPDALATATRVAETVTGDGVRALTAPETTAGLAVRPATAQGRPVPTLVHRSSRHVSVIAVLDAAHGGAAATIDFANALPKGHQLEPADDGSLIVVDGRTVVGTVAAPWARDARGRSLPTHYRLQADGTLRQVVDTRGATFPVVADPKYSIGFYRVPVWYVEYYWSEMWRNKLIMDRYGAPVSAVVGALCGKIPNAVAKAVCGYLMKRRYSTMKSQLDYGIAHKRCVKVRGAYGIADFFVFSVWTKKCIK
ncbi:hypothetical protein ASD06_08790 [Angustibacter sp. Root456]|nr:hypothetical protein ASD06_08790 [Angustibacter sp. Root456]